MYPPEREGASVEDEATDEGGRWGEGARDEVEVWAERRVVLVDNG